MSTLDLKARPAALFYFIFSLSLICVFYSLTSHIFRHAPDVIKLESLEISPSQTPLAIGAVELAQKDGVRSAEKQHLHLRYDAKNGWQIANIAKYRRVDAPNKTYKTRYLKRFPLKSGDIFSIKGEQFSVLSTQNALQIEHTSSKQRLTWQGGQSGQIQTYLNGQKTTPVQTVCTEDRHTIKNKLYALKMDITDWLIAHQWEKKSESLLFKIGGSVTCLRRWGLLDSASTPLFTPDSARIYWLDNQYWLTSGSGRQNLIRFKSKAHRDFISFEQLYLPVQAAQQSIEQLILGRSRYQLTLTSAHKLRFQQQTGDVWLLEEWQKHQVNLSQTAPLPQMSQPQSFAESVSGWNSLFYLLALILSLSLAVRGRLKTHSGFIWTVSFLLLCTGNVVLLQLAIGGVNERYLNLSQTFLQVGIVYQILLLGLVWTPLNWLTKGLHILFRIKQHHETQRDNYPSYWTYLRHRCNDLAFYINTGLNFLILSYFLMMSLQAVGGLEAGVAGYQPVEFCKFIVILISTISATGYYEKRSLNAYHAQGTIAWSVQQTAGLFLWLGMIVLFTILMLAIVRDFSPIVLIFLYLILFCFRILPHPIDGSLNVANKLMASGLTVLLAMPAYWLLNTKMSGSAPEFLMNADRFQVWANPALFPHSGSQVIHSMNLISNSHAFGQASWFSYNNREIMQLPAVQDDFIASFVINHFGYAIGLSLLAAQLLFVWQLTRLSNALLHAPHLQGGAIEKKLGYSGSLFCFGFAGLLIAHWLISWSNVLGLLPVMGQPMSMLSSGGSNLLLFVMPCLLLSFCFAWIKEA